MAIPAYRDIISALQQRLSLVADRDFYARDPHAHLLQLQAISEKIINLQAQLPTPLDPQLAHYFQRCSYDKALAFLLALDASV